jgi:Flp pilus assembly pilin Flp
MLTDILSGLIAGFIAIFIINVWDDIFNIK